MRERMCGLDMAANIHLVFLFFLVCLSQKLLAKEKIYYLDPEHINVTYYNTKYYKYLNVSARRFGRRDPIHYLHGHAEILVPFGNDVLVDMYFYEFLSNEFRRSFVEFHYKLCDMIFHDPGFLSPFISKHMPGKACPLPKGVYHLVNVSIPNLPLLGTFPFRKGRMYANLTIKRSQRLSEAYADVAIKERWL